MKIERFLTESVESFLKRRQENIRKHGISGTGPWCPAASQLQVLNLKASPDAKVPLIGALLASMGVSENRYTHGCFRGEKECT